jgi:hypothetical protein
MAWGFKTGVVSCAERVSHYCCSLLLVASVVCPAATAQVGSEKEAAERAAAQFAISLDSGDLGTIYNSRMAPSFRQFYTEQQFAQSVGMLRIQSGGPAQARLVEGSQQLSQLPTGQQGTFYYVRLRAKHPNGSVFEDIYLEKVGSAWLTSGWYTIPAPSN